MASASAGIRAVLACRGTASSGARRCMPRHSPLIPRRDATAEARAPGPTVRSGAGTTESVRRALRREVEGGRLLADPRQAGTSALLDRVGAALRRSVREAREAEDPDAGDGGGREKDPGRGVVTQRVPKGAYIHGPVGCGKSLLLDLFHSSLRGSEVVSERLHFHAFLTRLHEDLRDVAAQDVAERPRSLHVNTDPSADPVRRVALGMASRPLHVLCLDEFQVTDVADAFLIRRLFEVLWRECGVALVATSNRPPGDLYEDGLNREFFAPFVDMCETYCVVHNAAVDGGGSEEGRTTDYRLMLHSDTFRSNFVVVVGSGPDGRPTDGDAVDAVRICTDAYHAFLPPGKNTDVAPPIDLPVAFGRSIRVMNAHREGNRAGSVALFSFDELCGADVGAADYRAVASAFATIVVHGVPRLSSADHDEARRFLTLVDELYEARCRLFCSAAAAPGDLFVVPHSSGTERGEGSPKTEDLRWIDVAQQGGVPVGQLASVRELAFAFERCASRLVEMCSEDWWKKTLQNENAEA